MQAGRHMNGAWAAVLAAISLAFWPAAADAGAAPVDISVEAGGFDAFAPEDALAEIGGEGFTFTWVDPPTDDGHNVVSYDGLFTSGPATLGEPEPYAIDPAAGTFEYYCVVHSSLMYGTVAVRPKLRDEPDPSSGSFRVAWADKSSDVTGAYDVKFRVDDGPWTFWKRATNKGKALFGAGDPVELVPGEEYSISVRTLKAGRPDRRSRWSPPLVVDA